jgi:hypothetical protein
LNSVVKKWWNIPWFERVESAITTEHSSFSGCDSRSWVAGPGVDAPSGIASQSKDVERAGCAAVFAMAVGNVKSGVDAQTDVAGTTGSLVLVPIPSKFGLFEGCEKHVYKVRGKL